MYARVCGLYGSNNYHRLACLVSRFIFQRHWLGEWHVSYSTGVRIALVHLFVRTGVKGEGKLCHRRDRRAAKRQSASLAHSPLSCRTMVPRYAWNDGGTMVPSENHRGTLNHLASHIKYCCKCCRWLDWLYNVHKATISIRVYYAVTRWETRERLQQDSLKKFFRVLLWYF